MGAYDKISWEAQGRGQPRRPTFLAAPSSASCGTAPGYIQGWENKLGRVGQRPASTVTLSGGSFFCSVWDCAWKRPRMGAYDRISWDMLGRTGQRPASTATFSGDPSSAWCWTAPGDIHGAGDKDAGGMQGHIYATQPATVEACALLSERHAHDSMAHGQTRARLAARGTGLPGKATSYLPPSPERQVPRATPGCSSQASKPASQQDRRQQDQRQPASS